MLLNMKCYAVSIVLTVLMALPVFVVAQVVCTNQNPAVPITTPTTDFVLHTDGTVTHTPTGLMWMRCSLGQTWDGATCGGQASSYNWVDALQAAQSNQFAGYTDWYLPNRSELMSIVETSCFEPTINAAVFPNTPSSWFWSSSPYASASDSAWFVNFVSGHVRSMEKNNTYQIRLVRSPQSAEAPLLRRYVPVEDGSVIRDMTTHLEWQRCSVGQTWNVVQQSCDGTTGWFLWSEAVELTAVGGFRLPDVTELRSLVYCSSGEPQEFGMDADFTHCSGDYQRPTIVEQAFPNTSAVAFWSASSVVGGSDYAWNVFFSGGFVGNDPKSIGSAARLVRDGL